MPLPNHPYSSTPLMNYSPAMVNALLMQAHMLPQYPHHIQTSYPAPTLPPVSAPPSTRLDPPTPSPNRKTFPKLRLTNSNITHKNTGINRISLSNASYLKSSSNSRNHPPPSPKAIIPIQNPHGQTSTAKTSRLRTAHHPWTTYVSLSMHAQP